jgi:hypothetical protein
VYHQGWEENFFDKQTLADLQQEVDDELAAKRKALKVLRKQNKSLEYTLQYTIAEYLSKLMKSKWSNQFLVKHKMTNEPSKRGASTKVPMSKREKKLLLSKLFSFITVEFTLLIVRFLLFCRHHQESLVKTGICGPR